MEFDKTCRCPKCVELKLPRDGAAFWCVIFFLLCLININMFYAICDCVCVCVKGIEMLMSLGLLSALCYCRKD